MQTIHWRAPAHEANDNDGFYGVTPPLYEKTAPNFQKKPASFATQVLKHIKASVFPLSLLSRFILFRLP